MEADERSGLPAASIDKIRAVLSFLQDLAAATLSRQSLSTLLNEGADISPDMALRIEKAFGVSMDTLMRMQNSFDITEARRREGEIKVDRYITKAKDSAEPKLA